MTHLEPEPFRAIREGRKTIELRLWDGKRRNLAPGDRIRFTCTQEPRQSFLCRVTGVHRFASFEELYESIPLTKCGYSPEEAAGACAEDMRRFYAEEDERHFGVAGIEVQLEKPGFGPIVKAAEENGVRTRDETVDGASCLRLSIPCLDGRSRVEVRLFDAMDPAAELMEQITGKIDPFELRDKLFFQIHHMSPATYSDRPDPERLELLADIMQIEEEVRDAFDAFQSIAENADQSWAVVEHQNVQL